MGGEGGGSHQKDAHSFGTGGWGGGRSGAKYTACLQNWPHCPGLQSVKITEKTDNRIKGEEGF